MNATEIQLNIIANDIANLGHRLNNISSQLASTLEQNNAALEDLCSRMVGDHLKLAEVIDSFIRLILDNGQATSGEKDELLAHVNAFLARNL